eukprot:sb/3478465/
MSFIDDGGFIYDLYDMNQCVPISKTDPAAHRVYSRTPIYRVARGKGLCPVNRGPVNRGSTVVGIGCISGFLLPRPLKLPVTRITNRLSHLARTILPKKEI